MIHHLDKRSNTWGIRFSRREKPPGGKRVSLRRFAGHSVYDKSEAEIWFNGIEKEWLAGKLRELDQGKRISLEKLGDEFVAARSDLSEGTHRMDRLSLRSLGDVVGATRGVRSITSKELAEFKETCLARGLSPFTVMAYFRHIKAALNWALDEDYLKKLPKFPKVKAPELLPAVIPREDRRLIEDWAFKNHPRLWRYIRFALWTGCRRAECLRLRAEKVTLYHCPNGPVVGWATVIGKGFHC